MRIETMPVKTGINRDRQGRFISGASGNPNGRPKGRLSLTKILSDELGQLDQEQQETYATLIVKKIIQKGLQGDIRTLRLIWNYTEGMPKQQQELNLVHQQSIGELLNELNSPNSSLNKDLTS
jgi:hypothetical protein